MKPHTVSRSAARSLLRLSAGIITQFPAPSYPFRRLFFRYLLQHRAGMLSSGEDIQYYVPAPVKNPGDRTVTLFIWNVDSWKTVQWNYRDTLTAKKLLEGLAYVTNWDLTCEVKPATQQLTFRWDKASSLYSGIPLRQNKEYWVGNQKELDACILDSINKTMLENLGPSYTVYYADAEGGDLKLSDVGVTIPANVPYSSFWNY